MTDGPCANEQWERWDSLGPTIYIVRRKVNDERSFISREGFFYAESTHAPPAALIFFSANFEKYFAFTITGTVI
jgi:hypothetical protein